MRKIIILSIFLVFLCSLSAVLQAAKETKRAAVPVITSAMMFAEEFQKSGVTGTESSDGLLPKIFSLIGLRQYREITGHDFSVQIWDFKSASGFNIADTFFKFYDMAFDEEVYKSRPFIIVVDFNSEESHKKLVDSLKKIMPGVREAGAKEY